MLNIKTFLQKTKDTISGQITKTLQNDPFVTSVLEFPDLTLTVTRFLAGGSFANVYAVDRGEYVVKRQICANAASVEAIAREFFIQQRLSSFSVNVVRPYYLKVNDIIIQTPEQLDARHLAFPATALILMEHCGTPLLSLLTRPGYLSEPVLLALFSGILGAFCTMANLGVLNRDGKIENVLLSEFSNLNEVRAEHVRICDFGSASYTLYEDPVAFINSPTLRADAEADIQANTTPQYRAPEMIDLFSRMPIGFKSDVFALGVVFYRLMYKKFPFPDGEILANFNCRWSFPDEAQEYLRLGKYDEKPDIPIYSENVKQFVRKALVKNVAERASVFQLAQIAAQLTGTQPVQQGAFTAPPVVIGSAQGFQGAQNGLNTGAGAQKLDFAWQDIGPGNSGVQNEQNIQESFNQQSQQPLQYQQQLVQPHAERPRRNESAPPQTPPPQRIDAFQQQLFFEQPAQFVQPEYSEHSQHSQQPELQQQAFGAQLLDFAPIQQPAQQQAQFAQLAQTVQATQYTQPPQAPQLANDLLDFAPVDSTHESSQRGVECSSTTTDSLLDFDAPVKLLPKPEPSVVVPVVAPAAVQAAAPAIPHSASVAQSSSAVRCGADFQKAFDAYAGGGQFPSQNAPCVASCLDFVKKTAFLPLTPQNFTATELTRRYQALGFAIFAVFGTKDVVDGDLAYARDVLAAGEAFSKQTESQKHPKFNTQAAVQIAHELVLIYKVVVSFLECRAQFSQPSAAVYSKYQLEALSGLCAACQRVERLRSAPLKQRQVGGAVSLVVREAARICSRLCRETDDEAVRAAKTAYALLQSEFHKFREHTGVKFDLCEVLELLVL